MVSLTPRTKMAYGVEGLLLGDDVVGHVQHVPDLGGQARGVASAEGRDVQGAFLGTEGGDELAGEVDLAGVAGLMAGGAFQKLQQGQTGEGVGRIGRSCRTGQLLWSEVGQECPEAVMGGLLVLQFLAEVLFARGEGRQHFHFPEGDLFQSVDVALRIEVQQDVAHGPALSEEGLLGLKAFEGLVQCVMALVEALQGGIAPLEDGLSFFGGQWGLRWTCVRMILRDYSGRPM